MRKPWGLVWVGHVRLATPLTRRQAEEKLRASLCGSVSPTHRQPLVGVLNGDELIARGFPLQACSARPTFVGRLEEGPEGLVMLHGRLGIFAVPYAVLVIALPLIRNAAALFMLVCLGLSVLSVLCYRREKRRLVESLSRILECSDKAA